MKKILNCSSLPISSPPPPSNVVYDEDMIEIVENDVIIIISTTLLGGEGGEIKIILNCFQIVYYDLTISLNIFCEGLQVL